MGFCDEWTVADDHTETALKTPHQGRAPPTSNNIQDPDLAHYNPGCFVCGKLEPIKNCGSYKKVQYCSPTCQKRAWKMHKEVCNKPTYVSEEEEGEEESEDEEDW